VVRVRHNVTQERYCLRWHPCDWGRDTGEYYCGKCRFRVFYTPTPGEGTVQLLCIECVLGVKDI
jgi:hypothetical protein